MRLGTVKNAPFMLLSEASQHQRQLPQQETVGEESAETLAVGKRAEPL